VVYFSAFRSAACRIGALIYDSCLLLVLLLSIREMAGMLLIDF